MLRDICTRLAPVLRPRPARRTLLAVAVAGLALGGLFGASPAPVRAFAAQQCSDQSTRERTWTHGDPNVEDESPANPGLAGQGAGYYYLDIYACNATVYAVVYRAWDWQLEIKDSSGTVVKACNFTGTTALCEFDNAVVGQVYRARIANVGTAYVHDYAEFNSGPPDPGDAVQSTDKAMPEEEETVDDDGGTTTSSSSTATTSTSSSTATTTTTSSTTTTTTSSTSTAPACPTQTTQTFAGSDAATSSTSEYIHPAAAGPLTATVSWSPLTTVDLIVYNSSLTVVGQAIGSSGSLSLALTLPLDSSYKVKVRNTGSLPIDFTLSVTHC